MLSFVADEALPAAANRARFREIVGELAIQVDCGCGRALGWLRGIDGELVRVVPRGDGVVSVPDPSSAPAQPPTDFDEVAALGHWANSRWRFRCPRCRGPVVHRFDKLAERYGKATRAGRSTLVLGVDL